ncbi:MAG: cytochrome c, partial [Gammaproteobacteria bacterium]
MASGHHLVRLLVLLVAGLVSGTLAYGATDPSALLHMLDYVGVDYPNTVRDRQVVDAAEYDEQLEFSEQIIQRVRELPATPSQPALQERAAELATLIRDKADGAQVSALADELRLAIMDAYPVAAAPRRLPDLAGAATLYRNHCAACHGAEGYGDGPQAAGLEPPPNNFHDTERQFQRSLYGLYNTISLGVEGTAMVGFSQLSEEERWALAFYVGSFPFTAEQREKGAELWQRQADWDLKTLTTLTPNQIAARHGDNGLSVLAYLRSQPAVLAVQGETPLRFSARKLDESLARYQVGDGKAAY